MGIWIEIFGVVSGILYVILEVRQNRWLWPLGLLTSATYIYVFFQGKFYADMGLQVYYVLISIYGWFYWSRGGERSLTGELPVVRAGSKRLLLLSLIFLCAWVGIYFLLDRLTDSTVPLGDSFTTALAVVATWMLARKIIEHWFLWIIANLVSIGLYIYKGLYPTVILYAVYAAMAFYGYFEWKRTMLSKADNEPGT
jgi:nicotinamide mononucleotide transporter